MGGALEPGEADVLVAAAYLHDVGYAPELAQTGFHPVDGARFVCACGHERLAGLAAHHSWAEAEAGERGLVRELSEFEDERSVVSRALTYCDLTTDAEGQPVEVDERLSAEALGIDLLKVSVKARSNDGVGPEGEGAACSAWVNVLVYPSGDG